MTQTRPNGIQTITGSDPYNLPQNLADMADSINHIIPVNTDAERNALPATPGMTIVRLDKGGLRETYIDGAWRSDWAGPYRMWQAKATISFPNNNTRASAAIVFPSGLFTSAPGIQLLRESAGGPTLIPYYENCTKDGVTIWAESATGTGYQFTAKYDLLAIQVNTLSGYGRI